MGDVTVRRIRKVNHVEGCRKLRTCSCPFELEEGWLYDIRFRWPSGNELREKRRIPISGLTEKRAIAWATERRNAVLAAGELKYEQKEDEKAKPVPTLTEFEGDYLRHKKNQRLKASTEAGREGHLRKWIKPILGSYRLDEIDTSAIDLLKEAMEDRSEKYVNNVLGNLSNMVRVAKELKVIRELPLEKFGLFKVDNSKPPPFYTEEEFGRLVEAAIRIDARIAVAVLLGGDAGLRCGEVLALPPWAAKWDLGTLHVDRQVWRTIVDTPKSGRGRLVPMTDRLAFVLRKLGKVKGDRLLLDDEGQPFSVKRIRALMKQAQAEASLEATGNMHILRHTFCTRLAMKNVPPVTIQKLAGHKHLTTTMRYMHVVKGADEAAIAKLNDPLPTGLAPAAEPETAPEFGRILAAT
jgi:integrase